MRGGHEEEAPRGVVNESRRCREESEGELAGWAAVRRRAHDMTLSSAAGREAKGEWQKANSGSTGPALLAWEPTTPYLEPSRA